MKRLCCLFLLLCAVAAPCCAMGNDLVDAARLSMRGFMVKNPDRYPGPKTFYRFNFGCMGLPWPFLGHGQWDLGDCTGRAVEEWIFARRMTSDAKFGKEVEEGQRALLLSLLDPETGLVTVPELQDAATGAKYFHMWDQGRTLRALVRWWIAEKDPAQKNQLKSLIDKFIQGADNLAKHGTDPIYGEYAVYIGDSFVGKTPKDDMLLLRGGQLLEPLAMYWEISRDPAALKLARQVCAGVLSGHEGDGYAEEIRHYWRFGADGSFSHHFHDHASIVLGVAKFGAALYRSGERKEGLEIIRWAKRVYDWTLSPTNPNAAGSFGWFPENNDDGKAARQISEICCLADMIELAAELAAASRLDKSLAGYDAIWDHVERYSMNTLVRSQFKVTPDYARLWRLCWDKRLLSNAYITFESDSQSTYDHQAAGHQTLSDRSGGHLSQTLYAVQYDGQTAAFTFQPGRLPAAKNFKVVDPMRVEGSALVSKVETGDAALRITCKTTLGRGPYVVREFTIKNGSDRAIESVRFACVANLDFANYSMDIGLADQSAGRVVITPSLGGGAAAIAGAPRPDHVCVDDAATLLGRVDQFDWPQGETRMQGNPAGLLGWRLGRMESGSGKTVCVILAVTKNETELRRAVSGGEFPRWNSDDYVSNNLQIANRVDGGFIACAYPNDLVYVRDDGSMVMNWMGCCLYAGVRGLYGAWEPIFDETPGSLSVRMPLDRKGRMADQTVTEKNGRVVCNIYLRSACRVEVRISDWTDMSKTRAIAVRAGKTIPLKSRATGRWLQFGKLPSGAQLSISYPITERTTRERVGGNNRGDGFCDPSQKVEYTVRWRGNRVKSMSPAGRFMPLFRTAGKVKN